jgi:hypothetical protein
LAHDDDVTDDGQGGTVTDAPQAPGGDAGGTASEAVPLVGIVTDLGHLPPEAVISETALSAMFHRHPCSIRRAIQRGELPPPCRLFGTSVWTVAALVQHLADRQAEAARQRQTIERRVAGLRP